MSNSLNDQLNKFISVGHFQKALNLLNSVNKERSLSDDEILTKMYAKIFIYLDKGDFQEGRTLADKMIEEAKKRNNNLREIDGYLGKIEHSLCLGLMDELLKLINTGYTRLKNIENMESNEYIKKKAYFIFLKGRVFAENTKMFKAIELFEKSYELRKKVNDRYGMLWSLLNSGSLIMSIGQFKKGKEYLEKSLRIAEELNCEVGIVWALIHLGGIEYQLSNLDISMSYAERCLNITEPKDYKHSSSNCYDIIGHCLIKKGDLDKALHYFQKSLQKRIETGYKYLIAQSYYTIGNFYIQKGELREGLEYFNQIMEMPEVKNDEVSRPAYLTTIGRIHGELEDFPTAKKYLLEAIDLLKNKDGYIFHYQNFSLSITKTLHGLIVILVEIKEYSMVDFYLEELHKLSQKYPEMSQFEQLYRLDKAIYLKSSDRLMEKMEAGTILKKIIEEKIIDYEITTEAMTNLCEVLINELELTGDNKILQEIVSLSDKLLEIAQSQYLFDLLAKTHFFKAKISLLQLEIDNARFYLIKAQNTANDHGLKRLANKISNEHDSLLENLNEWEEKIKQNIPLKERIADSRNDFLFSKLVSSKMTDFSNNMDSPIYLVILSSYNGRSLFSKEFQNININEDLIAGFISAINMFGKEAFSSSGSIDRIKHGDNMIALQSRGEFIFGYVFKGKSYSAISKLNNFIKQLINWEDIFNSLVVAIQGFTDISDDKYLKIDTLVKQIFQ